ncbi:uncharacterized protein LOC115962032 [Quercus lobata]|uniref:uncharacterized protein LOC115962032 n=1 Tax=Quercus lobata TaxID=97700 RepID=UPI001244FEA6|nr:uncharacterized protein LOC115962032 [Quercus lobata]
MAHESQEADDKMWPPYVEHIFIEIMLEEQLKGNMENDMFKGPMWASITVELNQRTGKNCPSKQVVQKHNRLRLKQRKWSQLLRHTRLGWDKQTQIVTGLDEVWVNVIAISSNTPPLTSDEEHALKEELANANANAPTHLDDDCYTPNFESFSQTVEDAEVEEVTQRAGKRPVQDASGKGKMVSNKADRVSDMTVALKEYTVMTKERYRCKLGRSSGISDQFTQSSVGGDPCSLRKAIELLNKYEDLNNKAYVKISKALQQKDNRVVFMGMPEHRRKTWIEDILNPKED